MKFKQILLAFCLLLLKMTHLQAHDLYSEHLYTAYPIISTVAGEINTHTIHDHFFSIRNTRNRCKKCCFCFDFYQCCNGLDDCSFLTCVRKGPYTISFDYNRVRYTRDTINSPNSQLQTGFKSDIDLYTFTFDARFYCDWHIGAVFTGVRSRTDFYSDPVTALVIMDSIGNATGVGFFPWAYLLYAPRCGLYFGIAGGVRGAKYKENSVEEFTFTTTDVYPTHSNPDMYIPSAYATVGYTFSYCGLKITPMASGFYQNIKVNKYQVIRDLENALVTNDLQRYDRQNINSLIAQGGLELYTDLCLGPFMITPRVWGYYRKEFFNNRRKVSSIQENTTHSDVLYSPKFDSERVFGGGGLYVDFCNFVKLSASYEKSFLNSNDDLHNFRAGVEIAF